MSKLLLHWKAECAPGILSCARRLVQMTSKASLHWRKRTSVACRALLTLAEAGRVMGLKSCGSVLVTGANRGLGLQMVRELLSGKETPAKVIATTRDVSKAKELQNLASKHENLNMIKMDVTSQEDIENAAKEVESVLGDKGLNCLINNAAINLWGLLEDTTAEGMVENYKVNTVGPLMITKAFLPLLRKAAQGGAGMSCYRAAIINVSSQVSSLAQTEGDFTVTNPLYMYRTTKAALNMVTRCLAADLKSTGILCMAVDPGWVKTDMGTHHATLTPEESVLGLFSVIGNLSEKDTGTFVDWKGTVLPW